MKKSKPEIAPFVIRHLSFIAVAWLAAIAISPVQAQTNYAIDWFTLDGGGGASTGGVYTMSGTIGQPDAGTMNGGAFSLAGGFWAYLGSLDPEAPSLRMSRVGANVSLAWPNPSTGFELQEASSLLSSAAWANVTVTPVVVGGERQVTLPLGSGHRYFRLRKP